MQKIMTCLWFNGEAEEAMDFYVSIFKDAKRLSATPGPGGKAVAVEFELAGQRFMGLNGNTQFKFNDSVSLFVHCKDQAEVDHFWSKLTADGGAESMCGWLKDKYGVAWQIIPDALPRLLSNPDPAKAQKAMQAMFQMRKIDVAALEKAAA
jgi:predicted 3-demethylubiquinone-9 3-methyltransferase (glyoxalase superfamily)